MEAIAGQRAMPLAAPALQFPLANPNVASVLLGTAKPSSLKRNMELTRYGIAPEDYAAFEPHTLVAPELGRRR